MCELEKKMPPLLPTNKGVEIEITLRKGSNPNWTSFQSMMLCSKKKCRWYPDATPVAEFCTAYTWSHDFLLSNMIYIFERAKIAIQFDEMTNWQIETRSSNHIHFSHTLTDNRRDNWKIITQFAEELAKVQEFFAFVTASTPYDGTLSYRNGCHPYNSFISVRRVKERFHQGDRTHTSITPSRDGSHLEFRLPDGMIHPMCIILTTTLMDAVFKATLNEKEMEIYSEDDEQLRHNIKKILDQRNRALTFDNTEVLRSDYIKYVIKFYQDEILDVMSTMSVKLRKVTTQLINLLLKGKTLNSFTVNVDSLQRQFLKNQYRCYIEPFDTFIEFKKLFNVPQLRGTRLYKIDNVKIQRSYRKAIKKVILKYYRKLSSFDDIERRINVTSEEDALQLTRDVQCFVNKYIKINDREFIFLGEDGFFIGGI